MLQPVRTPCLRLTFLIISLLISLPVVGADNPTWDNLKQLAPGQEIRVVLEGKKTYNGEFESVTDEAIHLHAYEGDQTLSRASVQRVSSRRGGHRGRHALIGAAIGAGAGLGAGAAIDNDCSQSSIVCTGNKGKAILTPVFALIGAGIGALLPGGGWREVYRSK